MNDCIVQAISSSRYIKAVAVRTTNTVGEAARIHKTMPACTAALGRALSAAAIMGNDIKEDEGSITVSIRGDGLGGGITVVSDNQGNTRGYIQNPEADLPLKPNGKLDVAGIVGTEGAVTIIKDFGAGEPYVGKVNLVTGEIAEDITAYFAQSEQVPTVCALGVLVDVDYTVKAAGGIIISVLPGAPEEEFEKLERCLPNIPQVSNFFADDKTPWDYIKQALPDFDMVFLHAHDIEYKCYCSKERVEKALTSLSQAELADMANSQDENQVTCQFCDKIYGFSIEKSSDGSYNLSI